MQLGNFASPNALKYDGNWQDGYTEQSPWIPSFAGHLDTDEVNLANGLSDVSLKAQSDWTNSRNDVTDNAFSKSPFQLPCLFVYLYWYVVQYVRLCVFVCICVRTRVC